MHYSIFTIRIGEWCKTSLISFELFRKKLSINLSCISRGQFQRELLTTKTAPKTPLLSVSGMRRHLAPPVSPGFHTARFFSTLQWSPPSPLAHQRMSYAVAEPRIPATMIGIESFMMPTTRCELQEGRKHLPPGQYTYWTNSIWCPVVINQSLFCHHWCNLQRPQKHLPKEQTHRAVPRSRIRSMSVHSCRIFSRQ